MRFLGVFTVVVTVFAGKECYRGSTRPCVEWGDGFSSAIFWVFKYRSPLEFFLACIGFGRGVRGLTSFRDLL